MIGFLGSPGQRTLNLFPQLLQGHSSQSLCRKLTTIVSKGHGSCQAPVLLDKACGNIWTGIICGGDWEEVSCPATKLVDSKSEPGIPIL